MCVCVCVCVCVYVYVGGACMVQWLIKVMGSLAILGLEGGYTVVAAGVCTSSLVSRPHPQKEGKGSNELGLNPSFLVYGARQQGHAKVSGRYGM